MKARRALTRIYLEPGHLDAAIGFNELFFGEPCRLRRLSRRGTRGRGGPPCPPVRPRGGATPVPADADDGHGRLLAEWQHALAALGADIVEPPTLVAYVEHHA
jgi:hypothetical protein